MTGTSPEYMPTPEEIRASCLEIQAGWSERERAMRAGLFYTEGYSDLRGRAKRIPIYKLTEWEAPRCRNHAGRVTP